MLDESLDNIGKARLLLLMLITCIAIQCQRYRVFTSKGIHSGITNFEVSAIQGRDQNIHSISTYCGDLETVCTIQHILDFYKEHKIKTTMVFFHYVLSP